MLRSVSEYAGLDAINIWKQSGRWIIQQLLHENSIFTVAIKKRICTLIGT